MCQECVIKHLATAYGLLQEAAYPVHRYLAIGQLCLAEWDAEEVLRAKIREIRKDALNCENILILIKSVIPES